MAKSKKDLVESIGELAEALDLKMDVSEDTHSHAELEKLERDLRAKTTDAENETDADVAPAAEYVVDPKGKAICGLREVYAPGVKIEAAHLAGKNPQAVFERLVEAGRIVKKAAE